MRVKIGGEDTLCRTCRYASWSWGVPKYFRIQEFWVVICKFGCFKRGLEWKLRKLPLKCRYYKSLEGGESWMGLLDFIGKSDKELERELNKIREERSRRGKVRKRVVREKKVKEEVRRESRKVQAIKVEL